MKKIKYFTGCIVLLSWFYPASAHPGMGLVIDSKGNIYYTDLKHIWKQTTDGQKSIVVPNVHSHELYLDQNDNLFGEHLWHEPALNKSFHYQWCLKSSGELKRVTDTADAWNQPKTFSFARDKHGSMYWHEKSEKGNTVNFIKKDRSGNKNIIASGAFRDIRWLFSTQEGEIYFLDLDELYKLKPNNTFQLIAKNLCKGTLWTVFFGKQHSVFGVWFDKSGNTYAAVSEDKCIKKIAPNGDISIVYKSDKGSPVNGLFDKEGNLWVLEGLGIFESSVTKVKMTEISTAKVWLSNNKNYFYGLIGIVTVVMIFKKIRRKNVSR